MSCPWSASNRPRSPSPGSRSSAATTRTTARARPSKRLMTWARTRGASLVAAAGRTDGSVRAGAADRPALRVTAGDDRLDEAVIAVAPSVQDRDPLVLRVHEHEER